MKQQLRDSGQQLLTELATHHDSWQAKIHQQEHLVLKYSMQLSSAMAKEMVSPALLTKLEDNLLFDVHGLHHYQFRPSTRPIVKADIGFLQIGQGQGVGMGMGDVVADEVDVPSKGLEVRFNDKAEDFQEDRRQEVLAVIEGGESSTGLESDISGDSHCVTIKDLSRTCTEFHEVEVVNYVSDMIDNADDDTVTKKDSSRPPSPFPSAPAPSATTFVSLAQPHLDPVLVSDEISFPPGSFCIALWTEDSVWYRARVESVTGELHHVTFVDYG